MNSSLGRHAACMGALLAACTANITASPDTFNLEQERVSHLRRPQVVQLTNAHSGELKQQLRLNKSTWVFDQKQLTETAIAMLGRALEKHGVSNAPGAPKSVQLNAQVLGVGMRVIAPYTDTRIRMRLNALFGDGTTTAVQVEGDSPWGADRAASAAVLFALNQLLVDEKFIAYMNK